MNPIHGELLYPNQGVSGGDGPDRLFSLYRERLRHWEGGKNVRDPIGGPTNSGMSQKELDQLIAREKKAKAAGKGPGWTMPTDIMDLSDRQITDIFRKEYFDRLKIGKIADIPGLTDEAPALPELLFDAGIHSGISEPAKWLQTELNNIMDSRLEVDGVLGSRTIETLADAVREGKIEAVSDAVARRRMAWLSSLDNASENPGWKTRAESFLSENYQLSPR